MTPNDMAQNGMWHGRQRLARPAPPTAGMKVDPGLTLGWPLADDDFASTPFSVQLFSRVLAQVQEENLREIDDEDVAGFKRRRRRRQRLAR